MSEHLFPSLGWPHSGNMEEKRVNSFVLQMQLVVALKHHNSVCLVPEIKYGLNIDDNASFQHLPYFMTHVVYPSMG